MCVRKKCEKETFSLVDLNNGRATRTEIQININGQINNKEDTRLCAEHRVEIEMLGMVDNDGDNAWAEYFCTCFSFHSCNHVFQCTMERVSITE